MKKFIPLFFILVALVATLIPAIFTIREAGGWGSFEGVLPKGTADSFYYYARVHEVADGHPMIGNPYVYEYRDSLPPAFFLSDIVAAIPMIFGIPFSIGILINLFIWSFVFLVLAFKLLRLLRLQDKWALILSILLYVSSYSFMLRPSGMQIAYPVFLIFLITFLKFLDEPTVRRRAIWLSITAVSSFYVYAYLSYIVVLVLVFATLWSLIAKRFEVFRALLITAISSVILLIPFSIFTLIKIKDPYYLETFGRIGLVFTRMPSIEAFFYGRWVVIGLVALGLLWFFFPKNDEDNQRRKVFWLTTGAGLLIGLIFNVITGLELELGAHVGRFVILWMGMALGVGLYEWLSVRSLRISKAQHVAYVAVILLLLVLVVAVVRNAPRRLGFFDFHNRPGYDFADTQKYAAPLRWLDENVTEESVVWANHSISEHIAIVTKHYPLFFQGAILHSVSNKELEDRYLLSHSLGNLTIDDMKRDFGLYAGTLELPTEEYFEEMLGRFREIRRNKNPLLEKFHAEYIIIDRENDNLQFISPSKALYDDGRFTIFKLN